MNEKDYQMKITVATTYVEHQSNPTGKQYVFAYKITIQNVGNVAAQLLSRHWIITDASGHTQEVRGEGVVGEQPHLAPGKSFEYTSAAMIETPVGSMHGTYQMRADDGHEFDAPIAPFRLAIPSMVN